MSSGSEAGGQQWDYAVIRDRVTVQRLRSYLEVAGPDLGSTFSLYEWNTHASAAVLSTAAMVEVVVRNALDHRLSAWAGERQPGTSCGTARRTTSRSTGGIC